jgi:coenzyme Q-binding protein COQ10
VISHHETRIVPYPAELMYWVVSDVEKYPQFLPWVVGLRVLSRRQNGLTAEMAVGYGALRERYTSDVLLDPLARRIDVTQTKGPFKTLANHWRFTPNGPGSEPGSEQGCEIEFSIEFAFKNRLLHSVAGAKFEKVMLKMADAFEARAKMIQEGRAASF